MKDPSLDIELDQKHTGDEDIKTEWCIRKTSGSKDILSSNWSRDTFCNNVVKQEGLASKDPSSYIELGPIKREVQIKQNFN